MIRMPQIPDPPDALADGDKCRCKEASAWTLWWKKIGKKAPGGNWIRVFSSNFLLLSYLSLPHSGILAAAPLPPRKENKMISLSINIVANKAAQQLSMNNVSLQKSLQRLSSGSRIADPADDAGGLAVSMRYAQISRSRGASANIDNAISLNQVQDGALATAGSILDRMSELRSFADDVTKNTSDISNYNTEFQQLRNQLKNITSEQFNGISLFAAGGDATFGDTTPAANQLNVFTTEAGSAGAQISLSKFALESALNVIGAGTAQVNTTFTSTNNLAAASTDTTSLSSFSIAEITKAIENVATLRANNAAFE